MGNYLEIYKFKNGYGIKNLKVDVNNKKILKNVSIYASNGVFKTSFAKALKDLTEKPEIIKDRLTNAPFQYEINIGLNSINDSDVPIVVFSREILDEIYLSDLGDKLSKLAVNSSLIKKVTEYENELNKMYDQVNSVLDKLNLKDDLLYLCFNTHKNNKILFLKSFFSVLITNKIVENADRVDIKLLSSSAGKIIDDVLFQNELLLYNEYLGRKLASKIFDAKMNELTIDTFIKNLESIDFINEEKNRWIVVDNVPYKSIVKFKEMIFEEKKKIIEEPEMLERMKRIDSMLGKTKFSDQIREELKNDPIYLNLYSVGRKTLIINKIKDTLSINLEDAYDFIKKIEKEIQDLLTNSMLNETRFNNAVKIFKSRFNSVFDIKVENHNLAIIGKEAPILAFYHKRCNEIKLEESTLKSILSSGEKTALNIIKFIVEYENVKILKPIIIIDDIIETFDYINRYAFISYVNDMIMNGSNVILLTHNYEFYRTINARTALNGLVASCGNNYTVNIANNSNINFKTNYFCNIINIEQLLFSIPFAREISDYLSADSICFLPFLHYKDNTLSLTMEMLANEVSKVFTKIDNGLYTAANYFDTLLNYARSKNRNRIDSFDLKTKTIVSIAIRLLVEKLIIGENFSLLEKIKKNQTRILYDSVKNQLSKEFVLLFEKILIITPEFIHTNSFMYEPLIDVSPIEIIDLFTQLDNFSPDNIWDNAYPHSLSYDEEILSTKESSIVTSNKEKDPIKVN